MSDLTREFIARIQAARSAGQALAIVAGGTKQHLIGRDCNAEVFDVSGHRGICSYQPSELVLTARAATPLTDIEQALAEHQQCLSFEPPHLGIGATIGGTVACNLSGPARPWSGSVRDMVLGVKLINGKAEHLKFGGQVMKNVAGYDVSRLQAGALGVLGLLTEVSLKIMPVPATSQTLVQEMSQADAIISMNRRAGEPKPLSAAAWHDGKLYLRLSGADSAVRQTVRQWGGEVLHHADQFWREVRELQHAFFADTFHESTFSADHGPLWRFSVKSSAAPLDIPGDSDCLLDWGGAQRWLRGEHDVSLLQQQACLAGGQVSLFRGGDRHSEVKQPPGEVEKKLQQRLKAAFDPDGIFNPGRLYSWL